MYAKFDDERAGAGIPLPEGEPVTLGRAQIPAGIVSPLHRTQVSRKHVQLTRRGDTVSLEVISATHAVLVRKFGAEHASWRKLDPHSLEELAVGDGFALHPGVDRPVAFRLVDGAESPQDLDAGESAGVGSEATPREGVPASAEGAEAPTPGVGGLAEKRPRPGASEGHSSGQPRGRSEEDSPPHRRRRKVTFHPEASVAGAAAEDGTTRLRDAPSPAPTPSPLPRHPTSATAAPGGTDGGRGGPAERAVPAGDTEASATARPSAGAPVPAPTSGGGETAEESPQRPSPASSAAIPTADVPAWGGGRGTEVLEGRWRTTRGDEVHATVLVDGREVRIKRKVHSCALGSSGGGDGGGGHALGPGTMDVTVTRHSDAASALRFARAALGMSLSTDADQLMARELERQCGANVRSRVLLRGWDCSVCSFGNRVENALCEVCERGRRPQTLTEPR